MALRTREIHGLYTRQFPKRRFYIAEIGLTEFSSEHHDDLLLARKDRCGHPTDESDQTAKLDDAIHGLLSC